MQITTDKSSKNLTGVRVALQVGRVQSKHERWQNVFLVEPPVLHRTVSQSFGKIKDLRRQSAVLCEWLSWLLFSLSALCVLQSGYFSSMFSGSWKESNMIEINLEIPDQNIDTEGERKPQSQQAAVDVCLIVYSPILYAVCLCSSPSGVRVSVSGWCSDQAQPSRQYSRRCLYDTAGQCAAHSRVVTHVENHQLILDFAVILSIIQFNIMLCVSGRFDPAVWRDHEGKHQF